MPAFSDAGSERNITHGGMGLTNEVGLVHAWHDLRIVNIADGTNEILARTVAQRLLAGDVEL